VNEIMSILFCLLPQNWDSANEAIKEGSAKIGVTEFLEKSFSMQK